MALRNAFRALSARATRVEPTLPAPRTPIEARDEVRQWLCDRAAFETDLNVAAVLRALIKSLPRPPANLSIVSDRSGSAGTEFVLLASAVAFVLVAWLPKLAHAIGEAVNHFHAAGL